MTFFPEAKILCTGGCGFIGSHTVVKLIESGFEVEILDNLSNSKKEVVDRIEKITGKRPKLHIVDLLDYVACFEILKNRNFMGVVHFAGFKAVAESVKDPLLYYRNNLISVLNLLDILEKVNVNFFVFSSSATVYKSKNGPLTENDITGPVNPYGNSKLFIEEILRDFCRAKKTFNVEILRYFNPVGAHPSGLIGEDPKEIPNNLLPFVQQVAIGKLEKLTVFGNDYKTKDGTGVRDYIHVEDLAKAHVLALNFLFKGPVENFNVHNVGTGSGFSVLEIVENFEKVNGVKIPFAIGPRRAGDLDSVICDPTKIAKDFQFSTSFGISEICRDAWDWQRKNPKGII